MEWISIEDELPEKGEVIVGGFFERGEIEPKYLVQGVWSGKPINVSTGTVMFISYTIYALHVPVNHFIRLPKLKKK